MFRKLLSIFNLDGQLKHTQPNTVGRFSPYAQSEANLIYNLLFCDDMPLFKPKEGQIPTSWQSIIFEPNQNNEEIGKIAEDHNQESRVRILAFNILRENKLPVPPKQLLGVIVEIPLDGGLDVVAAYQDGRARYINQTGKMAIFEGGPPEIEAKAKALVASAVPTVNAIGPWDKERLPPPVKGMARMTFLVSDGLYFGEGPFAQLQNNSMASSIIKSASELLLLAVKTVVK